MSSHPSDRGFDFWDQSGMLEPLIQCGQGRQEKSPILSCFCIPIGAKLTFSSQTSQGHHAKWVPQPAECPPQSPCRAGSLPMQHLTLSSAPLN